MGAKSKNTTWAGIGGILAGLAIIVKMLSGEEGFSIDTAMVAVGLISAGLTGIFAKDKNVTGVPQDGSAEKPKTTI